MLPLYFTGYYNSPALPLYICLACVAMLVAGACMHVVARRSTRLILLVSFLYACGYSGTISGLSFDGSWLKVFLDALMTGLVLASLARVTSTSPVQGHAFLQARLAIALVTLGGFLACAVIFDHLAAGFTVVPVGLGLLAFRGPSRGKTDNLSSNTEQDSSPCSSRKPGILARPAKSQPASVTSTLFLALVGGVLLPLGSSDYNLLYMNLLPLVLSLLPPVLAGIAVVLLVLGMHAWLVKRHDASNHLLSWSANRAMTILSSKFILIYALVFEGLGIVLLASGAPHVIWAVLGGILLVLLVGTVLFKISGQEWTRKSGHLFLYLLLIVIMAMAGTILDAIKGSQVYTFTSPVSYNVVIAINTTFTFACVPVAAGGLAIELIVQRVKAGKNNTP